MQVGVDMTTSHKSKMEGGALQVGVMPSAALLTEESLTEWTAVGQPQHHREGHTGDVSHMGCFRLLQSELEDGRKEGTWTPQSCANHCGVLGKLYAVLRTPEVCQCGTDFGAGGRDTTGMCNQLCSVNADVVDGTEGTNGDEVCGAESEELGVGSVYESTRPLLTNTRHNLGCYSIGVHATNFVTYLNSLPSESSDSSDSDVLYGNVNIGNCIVSCSAHDERFEYAALTKKASSTMDGTMTDHCACAHNVGKDDQPAALKNCHSVCNANDKQYCGGVGFLNVFETGISTNEVAVAKTELSVTQDSVLLMEANGLVRGGNRAQQGLAMRFGLQDDQGGVPLGGYRTSGLNSGDEWSQFSTLGMRAVHQGVHVLSLEAAAYGTETLYDFLWKEAISCNGAYDTFMDFSVIRCSQRCRDEALCQAFTQEVAGSKTCHLYANSAGCTTKKLGHVTGVQMVVDKVCDTTPEGGALSIACPQDNQIISSVLYAAFAYIPPKAQFTLLEKSFGATAQKSFLEYAAVAGARMHPCDLDGDGKQDVAIFGATPGESVIPVLLSNGDGSFRGQMVQVYDAIACATFTGIQLAMFSCLSHRHYYPVRHIQLQMASG